MYKNLDTLPDREIAEDLLIKIAPEGLCKDANGRLAYVTKLSKNKSIVTHEDEGSYLVNNQGKTIIAEYEE